MCGYVSEEMLRKEIQREAGRKSWVTRRENERKRKASEAAKKAWKTRRANA